MTTDRGASGPSALVALGTLLDRMHVGAPDELPEALSAAAQELGWDATIYLVDYEQRLLHGLRVPGRPEPEPQDVDSSTAGDAYRWVRSVVEQDGTRLWVPLVDGVDRLGVLHLTIPSGADLDDAEQQRHVRWLTLLMGHLVSVAMPHGDGIEQLRQTKPRSVAAELLWQLLPPLTYACDDLVISGLLEPCYDVAGDAFDYSVDDDVAHLTVMDAAGHSLSSGVLASVALAAYRRSRRAQGPLDDVVRDVDSMLGQHTHHEGFVTGVFARLDVRTGHLRYVNCGHPSPLLLRGGKIVKELEDARRPLLGLEHGGSGVAEEQLEPGDWVVFYTDGLTEARTTNGAFFGLSRLVDLLETRAVADEPVPEVLRQVVHDVLRHQGGVLQDDATILVAQWAGQNAHRLVPG